MKLSRLLVNLSNTVTFAKAAMTPIGYELLQIVAASDVPGHAGRSSAPADTPNKFNHSTIFRRNF